MNLGGALDADLETLFATYAAAPRDPAITEVAGMIMVEQAESEMMV